MKLFKYVLVVGAMLAMQPETQAQEKMIAYNQLPQKAQNFIKENYPQEQVLLVKEEKEMLVFKSYEVKFDSGMKLEFDNKGDWKEVDTKRNAVPYKLIPASIIEYVSKRFPMNKIVQISRDKKKYEVELTNGLDLEFNNKGQFVRVDD